MTTLKTWPGTTDEDLPMANTTTIAVMQLEINKILKISKMIKDNLCRIVYSHLRGRVLEVSG